MSRESNQPDENPKIPAFAIAAVALALDPPFCPSPSTSSGRKPCSTAPLRGVSLSSFTTKRCQDVHAVLLAVPDV